MKRRSRVRIVAAFASLVAFAPLAVAQEFNKPPMPSAPRALTIAAPTEARLSNGLRVIVAERHALPLVTARLLVLSGNEADPSGKSGLASLTAGLLTQGTRRHSATQIATAAEALGGKLESDAGWDRSSVSMTVTTPKIDRALDLVAEVLTEPVFQQSELDRLRTRSIDTLKVAYSNPGTLASLVAARMVFGAGAYGSPPGGTPTSLPRIDRSDVLALYRSRYRPDNAVLILVGDIDARRAMGMAERRFGRWRAADAGSTTAAQPASGSASPQPLTIVDMGSSGQAGVVVAMPLSNDDEAAGDVTNAVIGGGYSSRLNQEIRIKRGLSYGARTRLDQRRDSGVVFAIVQTKNESAAEVTTLVADQFDRMIDTPTPATELAARKATLIGTFSRSVETTEGLAQQIGALVARRRSPAELTTRIERLSAVDADAVQRYARAHYATSSRRVVVAGNASQFEAAIRARVPDLTSIRQSDIDLDR